MRYVVGLVAVGLLAGSGLAQDEATKKEMKLLEGTWTVESAVRDGEDHLKRIKDDRVVIEGDRFTIKHKQQQREEKTTFKVDPSKTPRTMDLTSADGNKSILAIYELKGDTLKICFGRDGKERPTEFTSEAGSRRMLIVLKRAKS
ncbi:MAG: TIGR03067 domain-containing protein [Gemmataceae bacterium]|nr:TIGR03067 domain-containing protein [Gemmataceae bacterium]